MVHVSHQILIFNKIERDGAHVIASNGHSGSTDQDAYRGTVVKSERQLLRVAFRQYCNDLDTELCR